jgi:hypothetical protein
VQAVGPVQGDVGQGQGDELRAAVRAGEPQQQRHVPAGRDPGRPLGDPSGQLNHQDPQVIEE